MYFKVYHKGKLIAYGDEIIGGLSWHNELMYVPTTEMTLPIKYLEYISGHDEIRIFVNNKVFWGIVMGITVDKQNETIDVSLDHIIQEWTYRQISINNAVKDKNVNIVYKGAKTKTEGDVTITASPFDLTLEEVGALTDASYIKRAGASAWTANGETITDITVDASEIKDEEGEYDVTFTAEGASVTVKATVEVIKHDKENSTYKIEASDFMLKIDDLPMTDEEYIAKANATATEIATSEPVAITVDASAVKKQVGTYTVSFSVDSLTLSVKATIPSSDPGEETVADDLQDIYADKNFAYPGWIINMSDKAQETTIDYVYSRQDKLEALTKTMELTEDLFWRVKFIDEKSVDISEFGRPKDLMITKLKPGPTNVQIIEDPKVEWDFENVINVASVYSEKSDTGMSSMTLREVYNDPTLQKSGFPVVILRTNVNNERDYRKYSTQYPKLAPNNELEYAVIDERSIAMEGGAVIEGSFAFNDLSPFETEEDVEVTDKDRIKAAETAYKASIKKLIQARRRYQIIATITELPPSIAPGDKVRFIYNNSLYITEACTSYMKKILTYDDWFYVVAIDYDIDATGAEVDTITLEKTLRIDRDVKP